MKLKLLASAALLSVFSLTTPTPAIAQHVAGGIVAGDRDLNVTVIAGGWSFVRLLRSDVYNEEGDFVGYVHDAIVMPSSGETTFVIINVAGFLNIGHKLIAVPVAAFGLKSNGNLVLPNATKNNLNALPTFHYARY